MCIFVRSRNKKYGWPDPRLALLCQARPGLDGAGLTLSVSCSPRLWLGPARLGMPRACSAQPELAWLRHGSGAAAWLDSTGLGLAQLGSTLLPVMGKHSFACTNHQVTLKKNWVSSPWLAQLGSLLPSSAWPGSAKLASARIGLALTGSGWPGMSWLCSAQLDTPRHG